MFLNSTIHKISKKQTTVANNMQLFDLLQLSRNERETRDFCMDAFGQLDEWKKTMSGAIHPSIKPYVRIRGLILRRQAKDAVQLYKAVRQSRVKIFESYINELPQLQAFKRLAS